MHRYNGHPVVKGVALGPAHVVSAGARVQDEAPGPSVDPATEQARLETAVDSVMADLEELAERTRARGAEDEAAIFEAHAAILLDPVLGERMAEMVTDGRSAESAAMTASEELATRMAAAESPVLRERAVDFRDIGGQLVGALRGRSPASLPIEPGSIIVADDLTPSQTAKLDPAQVAGIALSGGGPTGHVAILARSLGITAVVGAGPELLEVGTGSLIAVDGLSGEVVLEPDEKVAAQLRERGERWRRRLEEIARSDEPAATADGRPIELAANVSRPEDIGAAVSAGARGSGLLRTELLYATSEQEPSEDEQAAFIADAARALSPHRIVVRTLDVGADKPLAFLPQDPEPNPFLGCRGIRLSLLHPDALRRQLRAILRGAAAGKVAVMFPFVAGRAEVESALEVLEDAAADLRAEGVEHGTVERGVMVEIPALALALDEIIDLVDFVSVGTNDLVQYLFAADRTNAATAAIGDALHPACLRLLHMIVQSAQPKGKWVGVCGEAASDPATALLLVGLGVEELSVAPGAMAEVKAALSAVSFAELERAAEWARCEARGAAAVRERVDDLLSLSA